MVKNGDKNETINSNESSINIFLIICLKKKNENKKEKKRKKEVFYWNS